jgi:hypothetical protein
MRTLLDLRTELIDRLNFASQSATDAATVRLANSFLRNAQAQLYWQYDFPTLRRRFTIALLAGTTLYDFPVLDAGATLLEPRRITVVTVQDGTTRSAPLRDGILPSMYDSAPTGIATHYDVRDQLEVWPTPDKAYTLHVEGFQQLKPFTADAHTATVDDELVFMLALANAKAHYRQPDAEIYANELKSLLARFKGYAHGGRRYIPGINDDATAAVRPMPRDA